MQKRVRLRLTVKRQWAAKHGAALPAASEPCEIPLSAEVGWSWKSVLKIQRLRPLKYRVDKSVI